MDLFGYSKGGVVLAVVAETGWPFFGLREDVVFALVEVALEEEMGFLFLASLAHQFKHSRLLLAV